MITLTRIDGRKITVNVDEIESAETIYDTTILLRSGRSLIVKEKFDEIIDLVVKFKSKCYQSSHNIIEKKSGNE
jgi:flagellar protein FlbD